MKFLKNKKNNFNTKSGFTIVETLVAVMILAFVITGPMVFTSQSIKTAYYARDQVVAFYMTQEIIELIKNARDNKAISTITSNSCVANQAFPTAWLACGVDLALSSCLELNDTIRYCSIGLRPDLTPVVLPCPQNKNNCPFISLNKNPNPNNQIPIYAYPTAPGSNWEQTTYKRVISIVPVAGKESREVEVVVSIYWNSGISQREFTVRQNINNWLPLAPLYNE